MTDRELHLMLLVEYAQQVLDELPEDDELAGDIATLLGNYDRRMEAASA